MARISRLAAIGMGVGVIACSVAACGSHHRAGGSASPSVGLLATVPDTGNNLRSIVEDNPAWVTNTTLMRKQWCTPTHGSSETQKEELANALPDGSPLGAGLADQPYLGTKPLGYRPAAATEELTVGEPPDQLTVVRVPIPKSTAADLQRDGFHRQSPVDGYRTFRSTGPDLAHASQVQTMLLPLKTVELSPVLIAAGGNGVTPATLAAVLDERQAKHPLSADPAVGAVSSALSSPGSAADSPFEILGSSLLTSPLGAAAGSSHLTPQQVATLVHRFGLTRLKVPATFAGLRYVTGGQPTCRVVAAALYPTPAAAKTAATVLGPVLRNGTSFVSNVAYRTLWNVQSVTAHGDTMVARLTLRSPQAIAETLQRDDFPLFWQPPMVTRS